MNIVSCRLKLGCSAIALIAVTKFFVGAAIAQEGAGGTAANTSGAAPPVEEVIVTGTSIRGVAPIGSNLITMGQDDVENSGSVDMESLLQTLPTISSANAVTQGNIRNTLSPSIHDLGSSGSNSTLILVDGQRLPDIGTSIPEIDPNVIPTAALQRVEVLATGASSTYGSDAVAGVINFITRSNYDGLQLSGESKTFHGGQDYALNVLFGTQWAGGSVMLAYTHLYESAIKGASYPWIGGNQTPYGGTNFNSFNCPSPTLQVGSNYWLGPNYTTAVSSATANAPCNLSIYSDIIPGGTRDNGMVKVSQTFGNLTLGAEVIEGLHQTWTTPGPATGNVTVFATGPQANPFFQAPTGAPTATTETVRFATLGLVPQATSTANENIFFSNFNAVYSLWKDWHITLSDTQDESTTTNNTYGGLCASCADLALNGTTNAGGSTTTPSIPGTNIIVTQLPLSAANALDIWNPPGSSNKTSAAVLGALTNSQTMSNSFQAVNDLRLFADGSAFDLPAGPIKFALGGERFLSSYVQNIVNSNQTGPSSTGAGYNRYRFARVDYAYFGEFDIPIISPEMGIPFAQKVEVDISGRVDDYSDFGHTANPKYAANWQVMDGLKLFANYSTSFVAPYLEAAGQLQSNGYYNSGSTGVLTWSGAFSLPTATYKGIAGVLPGCSATATNCAVATSTVQGIEVFDALGPALKPETGDDWSVGIDVAPNFLPGFTATATFFSDIFKGGLTSSGVSSDVVSPVFNNLVIPCPTGCTQAQISKYTAGYPITGALPNPAYFFVLYGTRNVINMQVEGIDLTASYQYQTDNFGTFTLGEQATEFTKFNENFGGGPEFNALNTEGLNVTFPSVQLQTRGHFGWAMDAEAVDLFVNYTGAYRNMSATAVNPVVSNALGVPIGGGDHVSANITVDGHASYTLPSGILGADEVYLAVNNIFNTRPPFYNQAQGYDYFVANPLGRIVSVGVKATF